MEQEEVVSTVQAEEMDATPLSFDEILADKEYQREFDRKVSKALETAKQKWLTEAERERTEAEKLAAMKAEERLKYEADKERAEKESLQKRLNAFELKQTAQKIALSPEYNVDVELLDLIDFENTSAEKLSDNISKIKSSFDKAIEKRVNDRLKETSPKTVVDAKVDTDNDLRTYLGLK
jgi:hypothetical protein